MRGAIRKAAVALPQGAIGGSRGRSATDIVLEQIAADGVGSHVYAGVRGFSSRGSSRTGLVGRFDAAGERDEAGERVSTVRIASRE